MAPEMKELMNRFGGNGEVINISIRPARLVPVTRVSSVMAVQDSGLDGDRYSGKGGVRQVTLIQWEHMVAVGSLLNREDVDFTLTRRNILVKGINLLALKGKDFKIGNALLQYSGECHPCSRMEDTLGFGGYNAMRGHGGITAKVIVGGEIRVGDLIHPV